MPEQRQGEQRPRPRLCVWPPHCLLGGPGHAIQPEIAGELRARKVRTLEEKAPEVIAAGNIGCMMQIGAGTRLPVVHTAQLLDWATGGPAPKALAGR